MRWILGGVCALTLWAQGAPPVDGFLYVPQVKTPRRAAIARPAFSRDPRTMRLGAVEPNRTPNRYGLRPLGTARRLSADVMTQGAWETSDDGRRLWRVAIQSPGAVALRVRFSRFSVGNGRVWVHDAANTEAPFSGNGPMNDGDFWSGPVDGGSAVIEYEPEPGRATEAALPFRIEAVAHFWEHLAGAATPQVAACELDYKCYSQWANAGQSVANIVFQADADQSFYTCSGVLLNTRNSSRTPYFMTANHCISTDTEARSLQAYWFYETDSCNGPAPARRSATRVDGARLLAAAATTAGDYSLVLLSGLPDAPVFFSGWTADDPAFDSALTGIHHPDGSHKRIAFGTRSGDANASVEGKLAPAERYLQFLMTDGRIEAGSSGSPVFDANQRVAGLLSYGPAERNGGTACDITNFRAGYGRFSIAYPAVRPYLEEDPDATPVTVTPVSLSFGAAAGVVIEPKQRSIRVETASVAPVAFTIESNQPWARLSRSSGTTSSTSPATVDVSIDLPAISGLGTFSAILTVRAGSAAPQTVSVRLVTTTNGSAVAAIISPNPVYESLPDADGFRWFYEVRLSESAGVETRLTQIRIDGVDQSFQIQNWFGGDRIAASGSVSVKLRSRNIAVPADRVYEFAGVDASGMTWSIRLTQPFRGPPLPSFTSSGVVNAATYLPKLAPGMLFTIAGQYLATAQVLASTIPLPLTLAGASVRINGLACPLLYVSPTQINAQIPYEVPTSRVTVTVSVDGREFSQDVDIQSLAPGVFTLDGTHPTPQPSGKRNHVLIGYVTGVGPVMPSVATGQAPAASTAVADLPAAKASVTVTIGDLPAVLEFEGIPSGIVGAIQINFRIPANAPVGDLPLVVTVGGVRANSVTLTVLP